MTVLVTGAAGFVGYHVAAALLAAGRRVIGVDNLNAYYDVALKEARLARLAGPGFTFLRHDIADRAAMLDLAAREPGIAAAALLGTDTWCGVIADGIHVHPAMLRLLLGCRGADRVFLVSDAMPVAGTARDRFELQGRIILRRCGRLETEDGTLAGADLDLLGAVRRLVGLAGVAPAVALRMASAVPAAFLGIAHERGGIAPGLAADLILLGPDLELLATWVGGRPDRDPAALAPVLRRAPVA
jgi:N-acetylglucosamine-6-phosphate deacetylase